MDKIQFMVDIFISACTEIIVLLSFSFRGKVAMQFLL